MFYSWTRIALIFLFFGLGAVLHIQLGWYAAWYLYAAAALLLGTHLLFGNVWIAFHQLKKGNWEKADALLRQIYRPAWLAKRHRAYYHFSKGMIELQRKALDAGEDHLLRALELGLRSGTDRALVCLNLAHIYFLRKDVASCRTYLDRATAEPTDDLLIRENVKQLEVALGEMKE